MLDIYLIPLKNGNFTKDEISRDSKRTKYFCCECPWSDELTFRHIFELPKVHEKLLHIIDVEKMVTIHDTLYDN